MAKHSRHRTNPESRGNPRSAKSISTGFGLVRFLTSAGCQEIDKRLEEANLTPKVRRMNDPPHVTLIGFVGMNVREQRAFNAGFSVARLEETLERGVERDAPRTRLAVNLGECVALNNLIICEVEDPQTELDQVYLAGQLALHGISPKRINQRIQPPHVAIGFSGQTSTESVRADVETALMGASVTLQKWDVYSGRYS